MQGGRYMWQSRFPLPYPLWHSAFLLTVTTHLPHRSSIAPAPRHHQPQAAEPKRNPEHDCGTGPESGYSGDEIDFAAKNGSRRIGSFIKGFIKTLMMILARS